MHKGLIYLLSLKLMKRLNSCLPKENLLDTTISLITVLFIKIGFSC